MTLTQTKIDKPREAVVPKAPILGRSAAPAPPEEEAQPLPRPRTRAALLKLSVPLCVVMAEREMTIREIVNLKVGSIIEFAVSAESELTLCAASRVIGRGTVVKVGERYGLKLSKTRRK